MKKCHACGQKIPLKVGEVVEGRFGGKPFRGIVTGIYSEQAWVKQFATEASVRFAVLALTRLHGYFRITERETL